MQKNIALDKTALPKIDGLEFATRLVQAELVGGDFYEALPVEDGLVILVGDVSGKGQSASMISAAMPPALQRAARFCCQPATLLHAINEQVYTELDKVGAFITACLAAVQTDPLRLSYASAGHTSTLLWRSDEQDILELPSTGMPLGISPQLMIDERQMPMSPGDVLLLYTDGVTEAQNSHGRVFGMQALVDLLIAVHPAPAERQLETILEALDYHRDNRPLPDDMVLFLARAEGIQTPMLGIKKPGISMPGFSTPENARVHPFVFPAEKSAVRSLAALVRKVAAEADARAHPSQNDFLGELELAISEIATNIVLHAYRDWPYQGRIQGRITTHPGSVQVDLIDSGMAFPKIPRSESLPVHLPAVELPLRGYGLMIADGLLEVCSYTRLPGGRNHWHLEKG